MQRRIDNRDGGVEVDGGGGTRSGDPAMKQRIPGLHPEPGRGVVATVKSSCLALVDTPRIKVGRIRAIAAIETRVRRDLGRRWRWRIGRGRRFGLR